MFTTLTPSQKPFQAIRGESHFDKSLYDILENFDVPVFWPILVLYFFALFFLTMKRQILHMRKHGYLPWSTGKKKWDGKKEKLNKQRGLRSSCL